MGTLGELFNQIQQQTIARYSGKSWWPSYQQAAAGGKDTLAAWMTNEASKYPDWTPDDAQFAGQELAMQQEHTRNLGGVNVEQSTADRIGSVAGLGGKIGAAAGAIGAAYLGAGALGAGAAGSELGGTVGSTTLAGGAAADTMGAGTLGSGITAGTTASGIGAGEIGTGLSAGTAGASGIGTAGATGTALAPGFFASETAYPVIGGASGVGSLIGSGGTTAAAGGATALGRLISGNGTTADYASILGNLGIAGLGYYGASKQGDSLAGIAAENRADRMPFYAKSLEYLNNPGAYASGPGKAALEANLRALSVNGNPADNPALLSLATSSALRDWRDAVTGFGNMGLSGSDTRASLMSGSANADANALNALGYGIGSTLNPPSTIEQLLKQLKGSGVGLA